MKMEGHPICSNSACGAENEDAVQNTKIREKNLGKSHSPPLVATLKSHKEGENLTLHVSTIYIYIYSEMKS